jgi:hypothetical protein
MKTYDQYIKTYKKGSGVAPEPIHFKHTRSATPDGVIPDPIHFKHTKKKLKEEAENVLSWINRNDNRHLGNTSSTVRKKLTAGHDLSSEERNEIYGYTKTSKALNRGLIEGRKLNSQQQKSVQHIDAAIDRNPIAHELHTYSGLSFDPTQHMDDKGKLRSPAYISTSHDKDIAHGFISSTSKTYHIAHIHLKPGDPATHIAPYSNSPMEDETIIKRGTTLQHHGHTDHTDSHGNTIRVHHMTVAKD